MAANTVIIDRVADGVDFAKKVMFDYVPFTVSYVIAFYLSMLYWLLGHAKALVNACAAYATQLLTRANEHACSMLAWVMALPDVLKLCYSFAKNCCYAGIDATKDYSTEIMGTAANKVQDELEQASKMKEQVVSKVAAALDSIRPGSSAASPSTKTTSSDAGSQKGDGDVSSQKGDGDVSSQKGDGDVSSQKGDGDEGVAAVKSGGTKKGRKK